MTDKINADTKVTQTHLNGIKSVFGGFKNWWNKDKTPAPQEEPVQRPSQQKLESTVNTSRSTGDHPALALRDSDNYSGFYEDSGKSTQPRQQQTMSSGQSAYDRQFDTNLGISKFFAYINCYHMIWTYS